MIENAKFTEKIAMIADPYFDREFFTNLLYCIDRKKNIREITAGFLEQALKNVEDAETFDRSLLQIFYAFQTSSEVRETYQWLPIAQALYSASLFRSDGRKPLMPEMWVATEPQAATLQSFAESIRKEVRAVESHEKAWASFLFLLQNRTTRSQAIASLLSYATVHSDATTLCLLTKAIEVAMAFGWARNDLILKRPFERFWTHASPLQTVAQGWRLGKILGEDSGSETLAIDDETVTDLWNRIMTQSAESALESINRLLQKGATYAQVHTLLILFRARCLFLMKTEQWSRVTSSLMYGEALQTAAHWTPDLKAPLLATSLCELVHVAQLVGARPQIRPTGQQILDSASPSVSKDRLILRLEDTCERGERFEALELMAAIVRNDGLSHSLCDRLLLMASKQDAWTFEQRTLPTAAVVVRAFEFSLRHHMKGETVSDAAYGLMRFLSDQRDLSLEVVQTTGTYGDPMKRSQYDVSGGARIVDRFVFNQMRNAQKVKIWPRNN